MTGILIKNGFVATMDGEMQTIDMRKALTTAQGTCDAIIDKFFEQHPDQRKIWQNKLPY